MTCLVAKGKLLQSGAVIPAMDKPDYARNKNSPLLSGVQDLISGLVCAVAVPMNFCRFRC